MSTIYDYFKTDQYAARNNIELLEAGAGHAKAKMTLHPHHWNGIGTVHGGALFTLADQRQGPLTLRSARQPAEQTQVKT
jgi:acyl-CoA thioesterase